MMLAGPWRQTRGANANVAYRFIATVECGVAIIVEAVARAALIVVEARVVQLIARLLVR